MATFIVPGYPIGGFHENGRPWAIYVRTMLCVGRRPSTVDDIDGDLTVPVGFVVDTGSPITFTVPQVITQLGLEEESENLIGDYQSAGYELKRTFIGTAILLQSRDGTMVALPEPQGTPYFTEMRAKYTDPAFEFVESNIMYQGANIQGILGTNIMACLAVNSFTISYRSDSSIDVIFDLNDQLLSEIHLGILAIVL